MLLEQWRVHACAAVHTTSVVAQPSHETVVVLVFFRHPRLPSSLVLTSDGVAARSLQSKPPSKSAPIWPFRGGDAAHTNQSPFEGPKGTKDMVVAWEYQTPHGAVSVSPAIGADGTVYGGADDGTLYALDGDTGAEKWAVHFPPFVFASPAVTSAFGGIVYFGLEDGRLVALHTADGTTAWEFVYFGSNDRFVYAVNGKDGKLKWKFETVHEIWTCAAIAGDGKRLFIGTTGDGAMYGIDTGSGKAAWTVTVGYPMYSSPLLVGDFVVFGADDGKVHALSQADGTEAWSYLSGEPIDAPIRFSPSVDADGNVLFVDWTGRLIGLDAKTGTMVWTTPTHHTALACALTDAAGRVYMSSLVGMVQRFENHAFTGGFRAQSIVISCPALGANGLLYVGADFRMYAVKAPEE